MVTEPKKTTKKAKRRRKPPEEIIDYIVEIDDWDFSYWLALNTVRDAFDPYHEHRDVKMRGQLLRPAGPQTDRITVSLFPSTNLLEERRKDLKPIAVGSIESYPDRLDGRLSIPADMLPSILQVLVAGRLKYLVMRGSKFRYRSAPAAVPPTSRPPAEPASPRSSNLRLAKQFTDRDHDKFKQESFEFIAKFFENSLRELEQRNSGIETAFRPIDANRFTAAIYRNGKVISRCTIFIGGLGGGIAYYAGENGAGDTLNESMSVGSDEHELHLKCLGMRRGGARDLSQEGAAEYYWSLLIERLQGR